MNAGAVRKAVELNPKLLAALKELARNTGLSLDGLVNLALYELVRRFGFLAPQPRNIHPPEGVDLLDEAEPAPPPLQRAARPAAAAKHPPERSAPPARKPARKPKEDILYYQVDEGDLNPIRKNVFLIGRGSKCDLVLPHRSISREHAVITKERNGWFIEDLNSANGTWLENEQIGKHRIGGGETIHISNHALAFTIRPG